METDRKGGFKSFEEFLHHVRLACLAGVPDNRLVRQKTTGHMEIGDDAQGGFLCPEEWADEILSVVMENAIVRPRAIVLKCNGDSLKIRRLVESTRATSYFGGITFTWAAEAASKTSGVTKPALGELELTPHKLIGSMWVSNELTADYENFGNFMKLSFGRALAFEEDYYFIWGTGGNQPLGIMPSGAMISTARRSIGYFDIADIGNLGCRLLPGSWQNAVWLFNPMVLNGIANAAAAGTAGIMNLADFACFGRPIIATEKCAVLGATGDVILADFSHYVIADRSIEISASRDVPGSYGFLTDETFWRVILRTDGQPLMVNPVTPKLGTNTLSSFVCLTAAS